MAIQHINLSLTNRCTANCVFCPVHRGERNQMDMSLELVHKILDEISSPTFPWRIGRISVGENGDAPLHKNFIDILRLIRQKMPSAKIYLATNFSQMKPELSKTLLDEGLLDVISVNIDGHDAASYTAQKKLKYDLVIKNLKSFVEQRKVSNQPVKMTVNYLTLREYHDGVMRVIGTMPKKLPAGSEIPYSNEEMIRESLSWLPEDIILDHPACFYWAERESLSLGYIDSENQVRLDCPNITRVIAEAWIAPNGDWYACCLDDNQELVWGNVMENTLVEIHNGPHRAEFLDDLVNRRWKKIGYPCSTVLCCYSA